MLCCVRVIAIISLGDAQGQSSSFSPKSVFWAKFVHFWKLNAKGQTRTGKQANRQTPKKIEQNRTEQKGTEQNRTEQNRTEQNRTEQNRTEQNKIELNRIE